MADGTCAVAPDKPGAISNNYQDPEDPTYTQWFIPNTGDGPENNPPPPREGNLVSYYVWGDELFAQMADDIRTAKNGDHFIHLTGFETSPDTPMGGSTLKDLLQAAAAGGAAVRGLLNGDNIRRQLGLPLKDNQPLHDHINAIGGSSVLDSRVNLTGAHHQKLAAILGDQGLIAYCGGTDLCGNRASRTGWHDVSCRIVGPAAGDVARVFFERWEDHLKVGQTLKPLGMPALPAKQTQCGPTYAVQLARTYPELSTPTTLGYSPGPPLLYAPRGERKVYEMILNAIRHSTKFIYMEDQFLVCHDDAFVRALQDRLKTESFQYLIFLTNTHDRADMALGGQAEYRRKLLLDDLTSVAPDKVVVAARTDLYFHAKTWVFDDKFAIVGSANCNNRGYFSDGEAVIGVADKNPGGTRLWFAHRLRMSQWMKHLDLPEKDVLDVTPSLVQKWKQTTSKIAPLTVRPDCPRGNPAKWVIYDPKA